MPHTPAAVTGNGRATSLSRHPSWLTGGVLALGILLSLYAALAAKRGIDQAAIERFAFACDQVTLKIQERLSTYAMILRGAAALFAASDQVDRNEWHAYVGTLRAADSIPGVQGIGYAEVVAPEQLARHTARIRVEGFPNYRVHPEGERPLYTSIVYLEPFAGRNLRAFGYDMYSDPVRRIAMERARDTGVAALSGKVRLVQETETDVQAGTLMYVPVYRRGMPTDSVEARRRALLGWAYSPYRMNDLMAGILPDWEGHEGKTMDVHIYDGTVIAPTKVLFDSSRSDDVPNGSSPFYQTRTIDAHGARWHLTFDHSARPASLSYAPALAVLLGGIAGSTLLAGLLWALTTTRSRAERLAAESTRDLRASEERLETKVKERTEQIRYLARELALTEERERQQLALDLHDNLGQMLAVAKIKLTALGGAEPPPPLQEVVSLLDRIDLSARSVMRQLSPPLLRAFGLKPALDELADEIERRHDLPIEVDCEELCATSGRSGITAMLYRSVRELLINAGKHAHANQASVYVACADRWLTVAVSDDGCGFDPAEVGTDFVDQHFGLNSIRERVANIGGTMEIDSSPGSGTTIHLSIPCPLPSGKDCHDSTDTCG